MLCRNKRHSVAPQISADDFATFFSEKVSRLHLSITSSISSSELTHADLADLSYTGEPHQLFIPDVNMVTNALSHCSAPNSPNEFFDPKFFSICSKELLPAVTALMHTIFSTSTFPECLKMSIIFPLLKKPSLDPAILNNFRPVSNLPFLSKVFEHILIAQLQPIIHNSPSFCSIQSA
jgi:hypothetical protein